MDNDENSSEPLESLASLFDRAVRALGEAGEADAACRLAAEAWWVLREPCPRGARRLNATLHRLTVPKSHAKGEPCQPAQTQSSTSAASRRRGGTS